MTLLFDIPVVLLIDFMCFWSETKELAILDTALCNQLERKALLKVFEYPSFSVSGSSSCCQRTEFINWLACRGIRLNSLSCRFEPAYLNHLFAANLCYWKLKSLTVKQGYGDKTKLPDSLLIWLVNSCKFLEHLSLHINSLSVTHHFNNQVISNVQSLELRVGKTVERSMRTFMSMCRQLRSLRLVSTEDELFDFDDLKYVLEHISQLTTVYWHPFVFSLDNIEWILANYPSINELDVCIVCEEGERDRLVKLTQKISKLNFHSQFRFSSTLIVSYCDNSLYLVMRNSQNLQFWLTNIVGLTHIKLRGGLEPIPVSIVEWITTYNPNVKHIEICTDKVLKTSNKIWKKIIALPQLIALEFACVNTKSFTDSEIYSMFNQKNSFKYLTLNNIFITANAVIKILKANQQITNLQVSFHNRELNQYHEQNLKTIEEYLVTNKRDVVLTNCF